MAEAYSDVNEKVGYVATCKAHLIDKGKLITHRVYCFTDKHGNAEFYDPAFSTMQAPPPQGVKDTFGNRCRLKLQAGTLTDDPWVAMCAPDSLLKEAYGYYVFGDWEVVAVMWVDELSVSASESVQAPAPDPVPGYSDTMIDDEVGMKGPTPGDTLDGAKAAMVAFADSTKMKHYHKSKADPCKGWKDQWPSLKHVAKGKAGKW